MPYPTRSTPPKVDKYASIKKAITRAYEPPALVQVDHVFQIGDRVMALRPWKMDPEAPFLLRLKYKIKTPPPFMWAEGEVLRIVGGNGRAMLSYEIEFDGDGHTTWCDYHKVKAL